MHHVSRSTPWEEIWQAMETLVAQGKVLYVGSSNFAGWHIAQAQESAQPAALPRSRLRAVHLQPASTRTSSWRCCPAARQYGLGVIPWSPLHGGLLGGVIAKAAAGTAGRSSEGRAAEGLEKHRAAIEAYEKLCAELGEPTRPTWPWRGCSPRPGVTAPIIGPRTIEQLDSTLGTLELSLDEATLQRLDELFPPVGNGGPGPEAWAW